MNNYKLLVKILYTSLFYLFLTKKFRSGWEDNNKSNFRTENIKNKKYKIKMKLEKNNEEIYPLF